MSAGNCGSGLTCQKVEFPSASARAVAWQGVSRHVTVPSTYVTATGGDETEHAARALESSGVVRFVLSNHGLLGRICMTSIAYRISGRSAMC